MMQSSMAQFGRASGMLRELGLTPGHMKALLMLDPDSPRPMGSLAQAFECDASTMTWLVDRLEERGLVERRMSPADRRVKAVALTRAGIKIRRDLQARLYETPPELLALGADTLGNLRDVLAKIAASSGPSPAAHGKLRATAHA